MSSYKAQGNAKTECMNGKCFALQVGSNYIG